MPTLKQITCSIELGSSNTKLKEYGARYSDGAVETFVAIPETGVPFVIHIESKGYIAPGLAVFVFIDGKYQSNRNKLGLKMPGDDIDPKRYEVDFMMRQKEEKGADGRFVGREWSFVELNTTTADKAASLNPNFLQNFGTIEVVVLRCRDDGEYIPTPRKQDVSQPRRSNGAAQQARAPSAAKAKSATAAGSGMMMGGMFDGANDAIEDDLQLAPIISYDGTHDLIEFDDQSTASTRIRTLTTSVGGMPTRDFGARRAMYNVSPTPGANIQSPTPSMLDDVATYEFGPTRAIKKYYPKTPVRPKNPALMGDVLGDERTYDFCDRNANYHSPTAGAVPAYDYSTGKVKNHDLFAGVKTLDFAPGKDNHQDAFSGVTPFAYAPGYNENVTLDFTPEKPKAQDLFEGVRTLDFSTDESIKTLEFSTGEGNQYSAFGATGGHRDDESKVYGGSDGTAEEDKNAQLDGMGGDIFINQSQYPSRAVDDMFGDKYLGLTGAARERMKRALRDNGHEVTESEVNLRHNTNYNRQSGAGQYLGRQPIMNPNLSMPPAANLNYDYQMASQAPRAPQKEVKIKPKSNVQNPPTFGSDSKIYCDQYGNLIFNGTVVAANQIEGLKDNIEKAHGIANRAMKEHNKFMQTLPKTHPDLEKYDDQGEALFKNAKELEDLFCSVVDAVKAYVKSKWNTGGGEDLVAKMRAEQDAFRNSQANAATGDFQQVGEGVIGGGATHNQNDWQVPQNDQKPASNTGGWGAPEKNDAGNTNGWGGEEQKDSGGWGDAAKAESKKSDGWKSTSRHSSHKTEAAWGNDQAQQDGGNAGWGATSSNKGDQNRGDVDGWGSTSKKGDDIKQTGGWGDGAGQATPRQSTSHHGGYDPSTPTPQYKAKDYFKHWQQSQDEYVTSARAAMKKREEPRKVYHYPAPQLPAVPEDKVNDVTHLVQPGKGADYSHRVARPVYLDPMERPYAVISFKYRTPETLETILKRDGIVADTQALVVYVEKEKLLSMPKDRLVEAMLQMKSPGGQQSASKNSGGQEKAASNGWGGNKSEKAASAAGGWGDSNENKAASGGGGWGGASNGKAASAAGGWAASNKGGSIKAASAGGWGNGNKENSGNGGGWNDNTNDAAPAAGGGWDGGNDVTNGNPSNTKHGYTPKTKDFAYIDNQPEAYNTKIYKSNYYSDEPSMATGYGQDEKSEEDHAFDGNREFVRPTRGAFAGRAAARARLMRGGGTPRRPRTPEIEEDAMAGGNLPSGW
ncbi:hypothetical protein LTR17_022653 [Elasticomyces elasticus]|nr:hypothetical protein LTR17_022653 [Elasticomyces elasticus]